MEAGPPWRWRRMRREEKANGIHYTPPVLAA
jgi:hypothetical protein